MDDFNFFEDYMSFVNDSVKSIKNGFSILENNCITPDTINLALALVVTNRQAIIAEYQRIKQEAFVCQVNYNRWVDEKFFEVKQELYKFNEDNKVKKEPTLKDIETALRNKYRKEYQDFIYKIQEYESKIAYMKRTMNNLDKFDQNLQTLSANIRSEMKHLHYNPNDIDKMDLSKKTNGFISRRRLHD